MEKAFSMQMEVIRKPDQQYLHIGQKRLKDCNKGQKRTLYNHKWNNPTGKYNNCKFLCTQHESTQIHKGANSEHKGSNQ